MNDYRAALNAEKTAFSIYSSKVKKKQHELNIIIYFALSEFDKHVHFICINFQPHENDCL